MVVERKAVNVGWRKSWTWWLIGFGEEREEGADSLDFLLEYGQVAEQARYGVGCVGLEMSQEHPADVSGSQRGV